MNTFGQRLVASREKCNMSQKELAERLGITPTRLNYWEKDKREPAIEMIKSIAQILDIDANYLIGYQPKSKTAPSISDEAMKLAQDYDTRMDNWGRKQVRSTADIEIARCSEQAKAQKEQPKRPRPTVTLRRPLTQVAAAEGAGAFLLDSDYDEVVVELNEYTQKADIILKVVGRSMEPAIHDGDHILVREQPSVEMGKIGVFIIDGNGFLKQSAPDRLISLNPNVPDVMIADQQTAECYGKFICVLDPEWVVGK